MTCDEVQDIVDDLSTVVRDMDWLIGHIRMAEGNAATYECDRVARAMHALRGAMLGFKDDVLGIIDG